MMKANVVLVVLVFSLGSIHGVTSEEIKDRMKRPLRRIDEMFQENYRNISDIVKALNAKIDALGADNKALTSELVALKEKDSSLTATVESVQKETEHLKTKLQLNVYFRANLAQNTQYCKGQTVKFSDVITNEGNGYDKTTGKFTAPVAGMYSFSFVVSSLSSGNSDFSLKKSGATLASCTIGGVYQSRMLSMVFKVAKDEEVYVEMRHSCNVMRSAIFTKFSGTLLKTV